MVATSCNETSPLQVLGYRTRCTRSLISSTAVARGTRPVEVVNPIGLGELGELPMGFRTETSGERSWAWQDPLCDSRVWGSEIQGRRSLVHCVGLRTYQVQAG